MKGKIILIAIVAALLGGVFYWFQWRPTQIRKECSRGYYNPFSVLSTSAKEQLYKDCLRRGGLEK